MYVFVTLNDMKYNSEVNKAILRTNSLFFRGTLASFQDDLKGGRLGDQEGLEGGIGGSTSWAGRGA